MISIDIPGLTTIELHHAIFDINGTLAVDGVLIPGVKDRLAMLANHLSIHLLTAGTHGNLEELAHGLRYPFKIIKNGEDKARYAQELGPANVIAFGNGANDVGMLRAAAIGIAVIIEEGVATSALQVADVLASGPIEAIDLVLKPKRLIATLRR
jgi:soluble P-type ATPase